MAAKDASTASIVQRGLSNSPYPAWGNGSWRERSPLYAVSLSIEGMQLVESDGIRVVKELTAIYIHFVHMQAPLLLTAEHAGRRSNCARMGYCVGGGVVWWRICRICLILLIIAGKWIYYHLPDVWLPHRLPCVCTSASLPVPSFL